MMAHQRRVSHYKIAIYPNLTLIGHCEGGKFFNQGINQQTPRGKKDSEYSKIITKNK